MPLLFGFGMVVGKFKKACGRFEMDFVRSCDIILEDLLFFCDRQKGKDPGAAVIDHKDDEGIEAVFKQRQRVKVVKEGQIADDCESGPLRPFGDPKGGGDVAVDAGEPAVGENGADRLLWK
jgi:hypothetical protein